MKTYSGHWETGGTCFERIPVSDLYASVPSGFRGTGRRSKIKAFKDMEHEVFENQQGRKLIVAEDPIIKT